MVMFMNQNNTTKNFSYLGVGRAIGLILQALFYLLFAALLDPELYGQLSVILALGATFATISRFGLNYTLQVYQSKKKLESSYQVKTLFIISTGVAALILLPINVFSAMFCFGLSLFTMYQQDLLGLHQYKKYMINSIVRGVMFFVLPIILYYFLEIPGVVLGMTISSFVVGIPFFKNFKFKSFIELKNHFKVLIQNFLVDVSGLSIIIDKLLISYLFGFFIVGVYQFNLQILMALQALPGILFLYLISEESSGATHRKLGYIIILASVVIALMVIALSPIFVQEFFPKYSEGIFSLQIMVLSIIPQSISSIFYAKLIAKESTKVGFVSLFSVGSVLALITLLGETFGLLGLSLAVLFSAIFTLIFMYFLSLKLKTVSFSD